MSYADNGFDTLDRSPHPFAQAWTCHVDLVNTGQAVQRGGHVDSRDVVKLMESAERLLECGELGDASLAIGSLFNQDLSFAQRCEVEGLHRELLKAEALRSAGEVELGACFERMRWMC